MRPSRKNGTALSASSGGMTNCSHVGAPGHAWKAPSRLPITKLRSVVTVSRTIVHGSPSQIMSVTLRG
jgi:hypothetical protein